MNEKRKELFEEWITNQFGVSTVLRLEDFHDEDGYTDQTINAVWLGFNAGVALSPLLHQ